jgi:hypothetical protein
MANASVISDMLVQIARRKFVLGKGTSKAHIMHAYATGDTTVKIVK